MIAEIIENRMINARCRRLTLNAPDIASTARPGQFVHVRVGTSYDPLLRRPLGVHDVDDQSGAFSMLYEIRGKGTKLLSDKCIGDVIDVIGPLGNGFKLPENNNGDVLIVAGGIGVAPLYYLAKMIRRSGHKGGITAVLGAVTREMLLLREEFDQIADDVLISTDDGSEGCCGFVTVPLVQCLDRGQEDKVIIYACGPMPMLKAISMLANEYQIPCQISTEAKMGCGVGACMSCVIKIRSSSQNGFEYVRSCKDGPVFDSKEVVW